MTSSHFHDCIVMTTGAFLSSLLLECQQPGAEKEGFLLGDWSVEKVQVNNDVQSDEPREQTRIVLSEFVSCYKTGQFYSATGRLDEDKIEQLPVSDTRQVVGWYRWRRGLPGRPSLRERAVHGQLARRLRRPLVLLLAAETTAGDRIQYEQTALRLSDGHLGPVRLELANLGEAGTAQYRRRAFSSLGLALPGRQREAEPLPDVLAVQADAGQQLHVLAARLAPSEADLRAAYREVAELRRRLADHREETRDAR